MRVIHVCTNGDRSRSGSERARVTLNERLLPTDLADMGSPTRRTEISTWEG